MKACRSLRASLCSRVKGFLSPVIYWSPVSGFCSYIACCLRFCYSDFIPFIQIITYLHSVLFLIFTSFLPPVSIAWVHQSYNTNLFLSSRLSVMDVVIDCPVLSWPQFLGKTAHDLFPSAHWDWESSRQCCRPCICGCLDRHLPCHLGQIPHGKLCIKTY